MENHEIYDLILDLILKNGNTTAENIKHLLPGLPVKDEARINLILEDMFRLVPKCFKRLDLHGDPVLVVNGYTHLLKEDGGFKPFLEARKGKQPQKAVVFQRADGKNPLADLHPRVQEIASKYFEVGHFRSAILDTYIDLVNAVKAKSGLNLDNTKLMQNAFSQNNPLLMVSDDPDEQQGFMWLFSGAVMAIRNPKAHRLIEQADPQRALEWLSFASVLHRVLEEAQQPKTLDPPTNITPSAE